MIGEEVQVSKGVKRFTLLFIICAVVGVFSNKLIQQAVQSSWAPIDQQMSAQSIRAAQPRIVFSRYGFPSFGAWIDTISWQRVDKCRPLKIVAKNIFVPIPFFDLFLSRPRAGAIVVENLILEQQLKQKFVGECKKTMSPSAVSDNPTPEAQNDLDKLFIDSSVKSVGRKIEKAVGDLRRWRTKMPFSKLSINSIEVKDYVVDGKTLSAQGEGYVVAGEDAQVSVEFDSVTIQKEKYSIKTKLSGDLLLQEETLRASLDWSYDEGHLLWSATVDPKNNMVSKIEMNNAPLSVVNRWLNTPWSFQFLWANCELHLKGSLDKIDKESWTATACSIKGPKGVVKVLEGRLLSLQAPKDLKFDVEFENFQIDGVVKGIHELPMAGVFKTFGVLNGKLFFRDKNLKADLKINSSQILFSKNNKRKLQEVEQLELAIDYASKKWDVALSKMNLTRGVFEGSLAVQYDKQQQVWSGYVDVQQIAFSPEVQRLMWGGEVSPVSLKGFVNFKGKKSLQKLALTGRFERAHVRGIDLNAGEFVIDQAPEEGLRMSIGLGKAELSRGTASDWIFASLLGRSQNLEKIEVVRVFAEVRLTPGQFVIRKSFGSTLNGKINLVGLYTPLLQTGTLSWSLPKEQYDWEWQRDQGIVELFPLRPEMGEWLASNSNFVNEFKEVKITSQRAVSPQNDVDDE